jgi:NhaP-type Na+/H+ or K+/H+ antiporter
MKYKINIQRLKVGVNPDLYYNVFGESMLNDGVAIVLYYMPLQVRPKRPRPMNFCKTS